MSSSGHKARSPPSTDNFSAIFDAALDQYWRATGQRLDTHVFATRTDNWNSPQTISNALRVGAQAFNIFRRDERLMAWLDPIVDILFTFSATLGERSVLVSHLIHFVGLLSNI
jgi:hypothetical protein